MLTLVLALSLAQVDANPERNLPVVTAPVNHPAVPVIEQGKEVEWATGVFGQLRSAAGEKRWGLVVSILLMACLSLFSWLFIRVKDLRDRLRQYMPEVAIALSLLGYIAVALGALPAGAHVGDWWAVIWPAIKTGLAAVGAYEVFAKRVLGYWGPKLVDWVGSLLKKRAKA